MGKGEGKGAGAGTGAGTGAGAGSGAKGGFYWSSGHHSTVIVRTRYYGPYGRTYGYGSYGAATGDCACGCGPLHFLCCFMLAWLILMMVLTFSNAPKARATDELYLEMGETRPYNLKGSAAFVTSKHDVYDKIGNTRFYQGTLQLSGSFIAQNPPVPDRSVPDDDWRWEGYWLNAGSTAQYTASCTRSVDLAVIEGDSNLAHWESNFGGNSYTSYYGYQSRTWSRSYGPSTYDQNVYWALANNYGSVSTCTINITINYAAYDTSSMQLTLTGSGTLDAKDGPVVMVPPNVADPRNVFVGPDSFTVGADMYTISMKQQQAPGATVGAMMGIFAAVCVVSLCCAVVMVNGVPECLGGDPNAGVGSDNPPGAAPAVAATSTPPAVVSAPVQQPQFGQPQPVMAASAPAYDPNAPKPSYEGQQYITGQPPQGQVVIAMQPMQQPMPMQPMQQVVMVPVEGQPNAMNAPPPAYTSSS